MTTTTDVLSAPVQQSFSYKLLSVPVPNMIHNIPAMYKRMPREGGTTLRMRRYNPLETSIVPLGNSGVTPPPQQLTAINIDARIDFYGTYIRINEQVTLQSQDPVLNEAAQRLGVALRQTEDELTRNMLMSTSSFLNCTGGSNGDVPTELSKSDVDEVITTLANNDAYTIATQIDGEDKFGTAPVRDSYFALASTKIIPTLENLNMDFTAKAKYPSPMLALREEWGAVSNLRFLLSSIGAVEPSSSASGNNVYDIFCVGMEAYAVIEQDGYSAQFIYRPPIYDSPLALNASVGYKFAQTPRITNDAWVLKLRTTLRS